MIRWPTLRTTASALAGVMLLAACSTEAPYVSTDYRYHQRGQVIVCYGDDNATPAQVQALADDVCREYDRMAKFSYQQSLQCSWTAPTQAIFVCVARPGENPPPLVEHLSPMRHDPSLGPQ